MILLGLLLAVGFAVRGLWKTVRARVRHHGIHSLAWRWLTGHPWHGQPVTDAGWLRPGKRALTRTGHASRFQHRPRLHRTAIRTGSTLAVLAVLAGLLAAPGPVLAALGGLTAGGLVLLGIRLRLAWRNRKHRRTWVEPLHVVCAPLVGIPLANPPRSWLAVDPDRTRAVLALPPGHDFSDPAEQGRIARAAAKLGIEAPDVTWRLGGPEPTLTIRKSVPPPAKVLLADVRKLIDESGAEVLVIGLGKGGRPITIDLNGDSPHIGLSMGSGGGKSVTARFLAAQMLYKGALVLVLDIKRISHMWARGLPNVAYARDDSEIYDALMWLAGEVNRRNRVADAGADIEGNVQASVGPRIIVICEEMNATVKRLRAYWRQERSREDPVRSPALDALDEVNFTGRQVRVNLLMIGQRLSAAASGGSRDATESLAALIFARYKPSKMLCPDFAMPPATRHPGRAEVVTDAVRQTQVAYLTVKEARELALSGRVAIPRSDMPFTGPPLAVTQKQQLAANGSDRGSETVSGPSAAPAVSAVIEPLGLREAVEAEILPMTLPAVRTARHRDAGTFPRPVGRRGLELLYDPAELADWYAAREDPALAGAPAQPERR